MLSLFSWSTSPVYIEHFTLNLYERQPKLVSFKFLHTSDLHIGRVFSSIEPDLGHRLTEARQRTIEKLATLAKNYEIQHIIVAGDVWDKADPPLETVRQTVKLMSVNNKITWWLMPGNHDPYGSNKLWQTIKSISNSNIKLLLEPRPYSVAPSIFLLPAPLTSKTPGCDLTKWMDNAKLPLDSIKVGVAHGSVHPSQGKRIFNYRASKQSIISRDRAKDAALDYLALGDAHGTKRITDRVWYSGTPEIDKFHEQDHGNVLRVEIKKNIVSSVSHVTKERTTTFDWQVRHYECETGVMPDIKVPKLSTTASQTLIKLNLSGTISRDHYSTVRSQLEKMNQDIAYVRRSEENLTISLTTHSTTDVTKLFPYQSNIDNEILSVVKQLALEENDTTLLPSQRLNATNSLNLLSEIVMEELRE